MSVAAPSELRGTVLLTGANGFTGRYVSAALRKAGYRVTEGSVGEHEIDLRNPSDLSRLVNDQQLDYVIHLAAVSFVASADALAFYEVNTVATGNLLEALARSGQRLQKIVLASSASIYGNALDDPVSELTLPNPVSHYACSKLAMEHMAKTYFDKLPLLIARPFNYTGHGQAPHFLVPKLIQHFAQLSPDIQLGSTDVVRDFSDVRTVANMYLRLLESEAVGQTVNICSGRGRSLQSILEALASMTGHQIQVITDSRLVRPTEVRRSVGDPSKLRGLIGPTITHDFDATLRWMLQKADSTYSATAAD